MNIENLTNRIICADCLDILRQLPDKCIDLVLTDPPYGSPKNKISLCGGKAAAKYKNKAKAWNLAPPPDYFAEIFRISKNQVIWGGNYFALPPTRCFNVWHKPTIPEGFSFANCEYAWTSFDRNAKFFEFAPQDPARFHPTQKPVPLIARQLEEYSKPGDLILDCFSGSGTTAVACHLTGRRFICIEKDAEYHAASVARFEECARQGLLAL